MKVKELIEKLEKLNGDTEIYNVDVSWLNLFVTIENESGEREVRSYI